MQRWPIRSKPHVVAGLAGQDRSQETFRDGVSKRARLKRNLPSVLIRRATCKAMAGTWHATAVTPKLCGRDMHPRGARIMDALGNPSEAWRSCHCQPRTCKSLQWRHAYNLIRVFRNSK